MLTHTTPMKVYENYQAKLSLVALSRVFLHPDDYKRACKKLEQEYLQMLFDLMRQQIKNLDCTHEFIDAGDEEHTDIYCIKCGKGSMQKTMTYSSLPF